MSEPEEEKELLGRIFELVNQKREEKPKRKKRILTEQQREKAILNLQKGRETSLKNRQRKAAEKKKEPEPEPKPKEPEPKPKELEPKPKEPEPEPKPKEPEPKPRELAPKPREPEPKPNEPEPKPPPSEPITILANTEPALDATPYAYNIWGKGQSLW